MKHILLKVTEIDIDAKLGVTVSIKQAGNIYLITILNKLMIDISLL